MRVGILGLGLMGASLAQALKAARPDLELRGEDIDPVAMAKARSQGLIAEGDPRDSDVLILGASLTALPDLLAGLRGCSCAVTDLASTKAKVMGWAAAAGVDLVGGHPMCGRERTGIDAADPSMFRGAPWVLTRDEPLVTDLVRAVGSVPVFMDAERHDRLVAGVSHAAFLVSAAYVLALAGDPDWEDMRRVAGSGFRDMSRLAGGDPDLYSAIVGTNRAAIAAALVRVEAELAKLRRHIEADDPRLAELLEDAKLARDKWVRDAGAG